MERNLRKERTGVVFSNKMDKTITVAVKWKEKHPIYGKFVNKTKVEEGSLYLGSPARFVRKLTDEEIEKIALSAKHYTDKIEIYKKLISN